MQAKSFFLNHLITEQISDSKSILLENLYFYSHRLSCQITIPKYFETDFCSVPRIAGIYAWLGGKYKRSGALHDYLYRTAIISRATADAILRDAIISEGGSYIDAYAMWTAVRLFGNQFYNPTFIEYR